MTYTILVVEDDEAIATALSLNLRIGGHAVSVAADGELALQAALANEFDLILLDINLPRRNGLEVLDALRKADQLVPVICLSARDGEFDKVAALRLGADDYVTKPFALAELLARIDAVLRRAQLARSNKPAGPSERVMRFGSVEIWPDKRQVTKNRTVAHLTNLEYELLYFFAAHPHQVFSRHQLFEEVWGQSVGAVRTVDNFVAQLRRLVETDPESPQHLITVRGAGYRFDP